MNSQSCVIALLAARRRSWRCVILIVKVITSAGRRRAARARATSTGFGSTRHYAHAIAQEVAARLGGNVLRPHLVAARHLDRPFALLHESAAILAAHILRARVVAAIRHGAWAPAGTG